jgi:hypothetical protein
MNNRAKKDTESNILEVLSTAKFFDEWRPGDDRLVEVFTIRLEDEQVIDWLNSEPSNTGYGFCTEKEWRHYTSIRADRRAEVEARIHDALGIYADYEREAVVIRRVICDLFAVAHVQKWLLEKDGEQ